MKDNVFVFCPTYQKNGKDQVRPETLASIEALDGEYDFLLGSFNPYRHGHLNILNQYQEARKRALDGKYDYMLTIEHDMVVPADALVKMLATGEKVVYGVYMLRHGANVLNAWRKTSSKQVGMSLSLFPDELRAARAQVVAEVSGVGFGCTLMSSKVLQMYDFHPSETSVNSAIGDVAFANDCLRANIRQVAHFGVICGHIKPDGEILWPRFKSGDRNMTKVKVIKTVNAPGGVELKEGQETEIPHYIAEELARAGYVSLVVKGKKAPAKPAAKKEPKAPAKKIPARPAPTELITEKR